jgi:hypothetical protein
MIGTLSGLLAGQEEAKPLQIVIAVVFLIVGIGLTFNFSKPLSLSPQTRLSWSRFSPERNYLSVEFAVDGNMWFGVAKSMREEALGT